MFQSVILNLKSSGPPQCTFENGIALRDVNADIRIGNANFVV